MKKIIALLLTLCMALGILTSCGGPSFDSAEKEGSFYEELAEAIRDGDDDKLQEIVDEIKAYGEERSDLEKDLKDAEEDYVKDAEKLEEKLQKYVSDKRINQSAFDTLMSGIGYAESYADAYDDIDDRQAIYDEIIEALEEAVDLAKEKDSAGVREIGIGFRDDYYGKLTDLTIEGFEYTDQYYDLQIEYGEEIMSAVSAVYSSAYHYEDSEYIKEYYSYYAYDEETGEYSDDVSDIRKKLPCSMDIDELEEKFEF